MNKKPLMFVLSLSMLISTAADARVVRFVVEQRQSFAGGADWGTAGPYERLNGTAYMEVDPANPQNSVIVNLDKAPRNGRGLVEFSAPFQILKPVDMNRGNRKLWYGINNRGNCIELRYRALPTAPVTCNFLTADDVGANNIILRQGYAIADAGWHGDGIPNLPNQLFPNFPIAKEADGSSIVAPNRIELQPAAATFSEPFITGFRPYQAADTNTANSTLTVRDRADAPKVTIAPDRWAFGRCPTGQASLVPTATDVCIFDGFAAQKIYELVYPAKDPVVMGLGHAVTRDVGSFLRFQTQDDFGNPNPLAESSTNVGFRRSYSSGTSSTGMYQREFLYLGFNEDEAHRRVFDAATIYSAATHRLFANVQFAHPTYFSGQDQHRDFVSNSIAPFTFAVTTDPISGIRDGILKRPATDPLVLQTDEELVFWQWKASLNVVDGTGQPLPVPDNVRLYFQNGYGHIAGAGLLSPPGPPGLCRYPVNNLGSSRSLTARALVLVIDDWADKGILPPPSNYPRIENGTLVTLAQYQTLFPQIPGAAPSSVMNDLRVFDFGPQFGSGGGIQTRLPPSLGQQYAVFVPRPDADGSGDRQIGINTMMTRLPLGTNLGWNVLAGFRAPDLCNLSGSFIPFATTRAERLATGDSRLSLEERYATHAGFVNAARQASKELVRDRFMLKEDGDAFIQAAEASDVLR